MVVQNAQPPPKEEYRMRSRESAGVRGGESKKRRSVCKNDTIAYRPPRGTEGAGRQPCHDGTIAWLPPVLRGCCLVRCLEGGG